MSIGLELIDRSRVATPDFGVVSVAVGQRAEETEDSRDLPVSINFRHIEPGHDDPSLSADLPGVAVKTMVAVDATRARVRGAREARLNVVNIRFELVKTVRHNARIDELDTWCQSPLQVAPDHRRVGLIPGCEHVIE